MRIAILFERAYHPDPRVRRIGSSLAAAGHTVTVLAWDRSGTMAQHETDAGIAIHRIGLVSRDGRGWTQLFFLARAVLRYIPILRDLRPDVLHAVDLPMLMVAILVAPLLGRPRIVYDAFEIYSIMEAEKYPGWVIRAIAVAEGILPRFADRVITVGGSRRAWLAARGIEARVVGNWIDAPPDPPSREDARRSWSIEQDRFVILYAGGLDPSRDLSPLVRHAERAPDDLILIAGRGSQETELRRQAERLSNVRLLGFVADPTSLTAAADALYYSLRADHPYAPLAAPNNLYVAIASALPLIHRGQGEIGALAELHDIGQRFDDDVSLDVAIDILRDPKRRAAVRASLRDLQNVYSWAAATGELLRAYPRPPATAEASKPSTNGP